MSTRQVITHATRLFLAGLDAAYLTQQTQPELAYAWAASRPTDADASPYPLSGPVAHLHTLAQRWGMPVAPLLREVDEWTESPADQERRWGLGAGARTDVWRLRYFVVEELPAGLWQIADGKTTLKKAYEAAKDQQWQSAQADETLRIARARTAMQMLDERARGKLIAELLIGDKSTLVFLMMAWDLLDDADRHTLDRIIRIWRGEHPHVNFGARNTLGEFPYGLGLEWPCTVDDIKRAYRQRALIAHPDMGGTNAKFHRLTEQYEQALAFAEAHARREVRP
jgi:hypothetical protein